MQLQIEYNYSPSQKQQCLICTKYFKMAKAKVIICSNQGRSYGEACPRCLEKGYSWLSDRFELLNQPQKRNTSRSTRPQKVAISA
jgi:hypothetical protein